AKQAAAEEAKKKKEEEKAAKQAAAEEAKKKKEAEKVTSVVPPPSEPAVAAVAPAPTAATPTPTTPAATDPAAAPATTGATASATTSPVATDPATPAAANPAAGGVPLPETPSVSQLVEKEPAHATAAAPAMAAGFISVHASEPGAVVLLDGRRVGEAPLLRFAVDGGRHNVTVLKEDFNPSWQEVDVNGNEVAVNLALVPYPAYRDKQAKAVWIKRAGGLGVLLGTGVLAGITSGVGVLGALLWVASNSMSIYLQVYQNDQKQLERFSMYTPLASPAALLTGITLTALSPLLAFGIGVVGSLGAAALLMTAGDPARYSQYAE
ncbi:MAG: PEGA domain-containing protein, partial [Myxococcota bacterium]